MQSKYLLVIALTDEEYSHLFGDFAEDDGQEIEDIIRESFNVPSYAICYRVLVQNNNKSLFIFSEQRIAPAQLQSLLSLYV